MKHAHTLVLGLMLCSCTKGAPPRRSTLDVYRGNVQEVVLHDGTRCVTFVTTNGGGAITCDWHGNKLIEERKP